MEPANGATLNRGDLTATRVYAQVSRGSHTERLYVWAYVRTEAGIVAGSYQVAEASEVERASDRYLNPAVGLRGSDCSVTRTTGVVVYFVSGEGSPTAANTLASAERSVVWNWRPCN